MAAVFFMVTMALYFAATVSFLALLVRRADALSTFSLTITAVGFATHTVALVTRMLTGPGASSPSIHEALSFFSWMLILVFLAVEFRHRLHVLGSFIVPLALVSLVSAAALPDTVPNSAAQAIRPRCSSASGISGGTVDRAGASALRLSGGLRLRPSRV